ncbi:hypothetical protein [Rhizobium sp. RAF56]|uniref:hypothetical protein n=1 Tax=Rhizobium sp. RAF56 TaxID=3233062 RepID=UPI003F99B533
MSFAPPSPGGAEEEALPAILTRIVSELHDVAYLIERVEPLFLSIAKTEVLSSPETMKVIQGIDLAVQKTRGIAEFIDTLSDGLPDALMVDVATALSLVKLAEMKKALAGGTCSSEAQPLAKAAGDLDFF